MKATKKVIGYQNNFLRDNQGWGCGYAVIPKDHPIMVQLDTEGNYLQIGEQEITYSEWEKDNYVIGFDTAHSWNNSSHNEKWVNDEADKLVNEVNSFTAKDAHDYIQKKIDRLKIQQLKYKEA